LSIAVEFSRPLALDRVPPAGTSMQLEATAEECQALAARFELLQVDHLNGEVRIQPVDAGRTFLVTGCVRAHVVQTCVVTHEAVPARVEAEFDRLFSLEVPAEADGEVEIDPEAELPEPITENRLDLGEILAEELSLALDPYPHSPAADRYLAEIEANQPGEASGPFDALAALQRH
jgi:uncharacterized metal-binding protein YceD (DUF177 family)